MHIVAWMLDGGMLGWVGYEFLEFNEERGKMVSIIIDVLGGIVGGKLVTPMFTNAPAIPSDFDTPALFFAAAAAAAFLTIGNLVYKRWGV